MSIHAIWKFSPGLILVPLSALVFWGCSTSGQKTAVSPSSVHPHYARLELDDGRKWVVDKPMMKHIRNIEVRVMESTHQPVEDHPALAAAIQENLGRLVTNCTMEGKAHDELHKWLMPFLGFATDYIDATELTEQEQKLQRIKQALVVFNEHFE